MLPHAVPHRCYLLSCISVFTTTITIIFSHFFYMAAVYQIPGRARASYIWMVLLLPQYTTTIIIYLLVFIIIIPAFWPYYVAYLLLLLLSNNK